MPLTWKKEIWDCKQINHLTYNMPKLNKKNKKIIDFLRIIYSLY